MWASRTMSLLVLPLLCSAADWPSMRGPHGTTALTDSPPLIESWDESGPPVAWTFSFPPTRLEKDGYAHSTPVIADGKVYVFAPRRKEPYPDGLDELNKKERAALLTKGVEEDDPSTWPCIDALFCLDFATGEELWRWEEPALYQGWGPSATPVVGEGVSGLRLADHGRRIPCASRPARCCLL